MTQKTPTHYDLIIIGSGPSGRSAAIQAGKLKQKVLVVDRQAQVGGVSVHTGTIPSKTLRETILNLSGYRERTFYGRSYRAREDITAQDLRQRVRKTLSYEVDNLEDMFARNHVETMRGAARFVNETTIEVTQDSQTETFTAKHFIVSVGTKPYRPDDIGFNGHTIVDSDELINLKSLPRSLIVLGAGVIGVEYATMFQALDVKVTLIESRDTFLDFIDKTLMQEFIHEIRDLGIDLRLGSPVVEVAEQPDKTISVTTKNGRTARAEMFLFAAGRMGATQHLNLSACGVKTDSRGRISVDKTTYQTNKPHIYATGDVIGFPSLASTSLSQGRVAACHAFGVKIPPQSAWFPYGIYSVPEISTCGMSEEELQDQGIPYEVGCAKFRETARGNIMGITQGMLKMLVSLKTRRILGVQIMGEGATEMIHIAQAVMNYKGTVDYFIENTFNYPTLAEVYKSAAFDAWARMPALTISDE